MKLILLLLSIILTSCGGSSGGGGNSYGPDVCGNTKSSCGPFYIKKATALRSINKKKFIDLLTATEEKILDIKIGMTYLRFDRCQVSAGGQNISEEIVSSYTVLEFNKENREIKALVEVLATPKTEYCYSKDELEDKKYVSIAPIPTVSEASDSLEGIFDVYQQGIIDGNPAIVASKKEFQDGYDTKIEFGINLNMPISFGFYFEGTSKGSDGSGVRQRFSSPLSIVDTSDIDVADLPVVYEYFK